MSGYGYKLYEWMVVYGCYERVSRKICEKVGVEKQVIEWGIRERASFYGQPSL